MQLNAAGNIYIAGSLTPASKAVLSMTSAFVAKLSADGSQLFYFTVLAGSIADAATALALGSDGSAYVTGNTNSPDFPVTAGALQPTYIGGGQNPPLPQSRRPASPQDAHGILLNLRVRGKNSHPMHDGLRDQHPIERIGVETG